LAGAVPSARKVLEIGRGGRLIARRFRDAAVTMMLGVACSTYASLLPTDSLWQQSLDQSTWSAADVQIDNPFADVLWPFSATGAERAYFRRSFVLDTIPTYSAFHYSFGGDGKAWLNGVLIVDDNDDSRTSGGVETTSLTHAGLNELFVVIAPTPGSGFPGHFHSYAEFSDAQVVSLPGSLALTTIGLAVLLRRRPTFSRVLSRARCKLPLLCGR